MKATTVNSVPQTSHLLSHQAPIYVASVTLRVNHLDRMAAFYQNVVGLSLLSTHAGHAILGADHVPLLEFIEDTHAKARPVGMPGLFHTAFLLPDRKSLGEWLHHAIAQKIRLEGLSDHLVSEAAYLSDPEGNGIEIYSDRPTAAWNHANGTITMGTSRMDVEAVLASASHESATQPYRVPVETRVGHVHLGVGHVEDAGQFISNVFDMRKTTDYPQAAFYASGDYHHHLAVNTWQSTSGNLFKPGYCGLMSVRLETRMQDDHTQLAQRMVDAGATRSNGQWQLSGPSKIPFSLSIG